MYYTTAMSKALFGKAVVNKTTLDKLDSALTKLNNEGSDVRQVILEKYGFDVFNEDA